MLLMVVQMTCLLRTVQWPSPVCWGEWQWDPCSCSRQYSRNTNSPVDSSAACHSRDSVWGVSHLYTHTHAYAHAGCTSSQFAKFYIACRSKNQRRLLPVYKIRDNACSIVDLSKHYGLDIFTATQQQTKVDSSHSTGSLLYLKIRCQINK